MYFHQLPLKCQQRHFFPIGILDVLLLVENHITENLVWQKSSVKQKHHAQIGWGFLSVKNTGNKKKLFEIDNSYENNKLAFSHVKDFSM